MPRAIRDAHYDRIQRYYESGTSFGLSVAHTLYVLATVLEKADNDLLWLTILSVTHQYIAARIDREKYESYHELFADEVARLNHEGLGPRVPNPDERGILQTEELRFMMFRHWNLYDAMLHSGYVAGRMTIWKERGRKRLQGLLAKMGWALLIQEFTACTDFRFSLQQCQQAYAHMDMNLKRDLPAKLDSIAPEYGLVELSYPSFSRQFGFSLALSAADAVEGLSALLEAAQGVRLEVEREGGRGGGEWFGGTRLWNIATKESRNPDAKGKENVDPRRSDAPPAATQEKPQEQAWHVTNFWTAFDACEQSVPSAPCPLIKLTKQSQPPPPITPARHVFASRNHPSRLGATGQSCHPTAPDLPLCDHARRS